MHSLTKTSSGNHSQGQQFSLQHSNSNSNSNGWYKLIAFKLGAVGSAIFLFFSTSSLVSFTLRETQARMLRFTYLLQYYIENELSITALVLTHSTESLMMVPVMVGVQFFLKEFFGSHALAFVVLSLVWFAGKF